MYSKVFVSNHLSATPDPLISFPWPKNYQNHGKPTCWSQLQSHFPQRSSGREASRNLSESKNYPEKKNHSIWTTPGLEVVVDLDKTSRSLEVAQCLLHGPLGYCPGWATKWMATCKRKGAALVEFIKQLKEGLSLVTHIEKVWKFEERSTTSIRSSMHVSPRFLIPQNTSSPLGNEGRLQPYPGGAFCTLHVYLCSFKVKFCTLKIYVCSLKDSESIFVYFEIMLCTSEVYFCTLRVHFVIWKHTFCRLKIHSYILKIESFKGHLKGLL